MMKASIVDVISIIDALPIASALPIAVSRTDRQHLPMVVRRCRRIADGFRSPTDLAKSK
jgi:hypothetical protein